MTNTRLEKLNTLYTAIDAYSGTDNDMENSLNVLINKQEQEYLKLEVLPDVMKMLEERLKGLRCKVDLLVEYTAEKGIDYTFNSSAGSNSTDVSSTSDQTSTNQLETIENLSLDKDKIEAKIAKQKENDTHTTADGFNKKSTPNLGNKKTSVLTQISKPTITTSYDSEDLIEKYATAFSKIRTSYRDGMKTPHKAVLLIAIFRGIKNGSIQTNKIEFNEGLKTLFQEVWNEYVPSHMPFACNIVNPFIHLSSDSFYELDLKRPVNILGISWSESQINKLCNHAVIDEGLFMLIRDTNSHLLFQEQLEKQFGFDNFKPAGYKETDGDASIAAEPEQNELEKEDSSDDNGENTNDDFANTQRRQFFNWLTTAIDEKGNYIVLETAKKYIALLDGNKEITNATKAVALCYSIFDVKNFSLLNKIEDCIVKKYDDALVSYDTRFALKLYLDYFAET